MVEGSWHGTGDGERWDDVAELDSISDRKKEEIIGNMDRQ
jgi:hypothetical protein